MKWLLIWLLVQGDMVYMKAGGVFYNVEECEIARLMVPRERNIESICIETDQLGGA